MAELVKNSIHTVTIDGYTSSGDGVARIEGRAVFVKGGIHGEHCRIKILKVSKTAIYAKIEQLLEISPHRMVPLCPVFGKCGGCALMHMDYGEELSMKQNRVQEAFTRIGGIDLKLDGIIRADCTEGYRNKAIYAVGWADGGIRAGFYRPRSHDIVPAEHCLIQADVSARAAGAVLRWMEQTGAAPYDPKTCTGTVRHIFCRSGFASGQAQITIVSSSTRLPKTDLLIRQISSACPEVCSIVLNVNKTRGNTVLAGDFITLWGTDYIEDILCGLRFKLSPRSFYQINHAQAQRLYDKAIEYAELSGRETILDLYCGTGTITLCLARRAGRVIGAEIVESAIADAQANARANNITNAEFICADASAAAEQLQTAGLRPDVVVVDPPRKGLAEDVITTIAAMAPDRVVYVSCDPATLARDLRRFALAGYTAVKAEAVDMFPHTPHVECVTLMSRVEE
jgi:23S rRNA (uracil1939-C5)-methyltransferase